MPWTDDRAFLAWMLIGKGLPEVLAEKIVLKTYEIGGRDGVYRWIDWPARVSWAEAMRRDMRDATR